MWRNVRVRGLGAYRQILSDGGGLWSRGHEVGSGFFGRPSRAMSYADHHETSPSVCVRVCARVRMPVRERVLVCVCVCLCVCVCVCVCVFGCGSGLLVCVCLVVVSCGCAVA